MNADETRNILRAFVLIQPAYAEWRNKHAHELAEGYGGKAEDMWEEMLSSISRTLDGVSEAEALEVISSMESGRLPIPPYGELALMILREAKVSREPPCQHYESQTTYTCLDCLDSGIVNMWNPNFLESYRVEFASVTRTEAPRKSKRDSIPGLKSIGFDLDKYDPEGLVTAWVYEPSNWEHLANKSWKRSGGQGPMHHVALCHCGCRRAKVLEHELEEFQAKRRKTPPPNPKPAGMPACGAVRFNPQKMIKKTQSSFEDLTNYYATHEFNQIHEWTG